MNVFTKGLSDHLTDEKSTFSCEKSFDLGFPKMTKLNVYVEVPFVDIRGKKGVKTLRNFTNSLLFLVTCPHGEQETMWRPTSLALVPPLKEVEDLIVL